METKTVPPIVCHEPKDNRSEWITPAVVDYSIEEATLLTLAGSGGDGPSSYS